MQKNLLLALVAADYAPVVVCWSLPQSIIANVHNVMMMMIMPLQITYT